MPEIPLPSGFLPSADPSVRLAPCQDLGDQQTTVTPGCEQDVCTAVAPPFRAPTPAQPSPPGLVGLPTVGQRVDEFELLHELGSGSFARVFLARQVSLGRQVALKVSRNRGHEGKTLASLEHDHIVRVFSEVIHGDLRLLCMQYVPGPTLERIIARLASLPTGQRTGRAFLEAVDTLRDVPATLDLAGLRVRELLNQADAIETACWVGARLAEALAHAHGLGVLHRDIKPANILVNPYGRPLLADFNVAAQVSDGEASIGGTLAYMAPEHLDAFNPEASTPPEAVGARSDVYSLGVLLCEFLTGRLPFATPSELPPGRPTEVLREMARRRREEAPNLPDEQDAPPAMLRVLARCLAPRPEDRYQTAAELARALDGCRELRRIEKELPAPGVLTRFTLRHPFLMASLLTLLPQLMGSGVNITYNALRIVDRLTPKQKDLFPELVLVYNILLYPLCVYLLYRQAAPVFRTWRKLSGSGPIEQAEVDATRRRALNLPLWGVGVACLGWLPGGLAFPLAMDYLAGPVPRTVFLAFAVSFTVSGLIALTYSVFAIQFIVLRVLYPRLWLDARDLHTTACAELAFVEGRLAVLQFLAVLIPLTGAWLLLGLGPEEFSESSYHTFRLLVAALMGVGMLGLGVGILISSTLRKTVAALVGTGQRETGP